MISTKVLPPCLVSLCMLCLRRQQHVFFTYGCVDPGFLYRQPDCAVVALNYLKKCWEVYQAYCRVNASTGDDQTMTCKQLLWMFKVQQTHEEMDAVSAELRQYFRNGNPSTSCHQSGCKLFLFLSLTTNPRISICWTIT